ncbi:MAG: hypothetical protein ACXWL8_02240 [Candidatus Limnocylindria bacterium]
MEDQKVMLPKDDPKPAGDWPKPPVQPGGDMPKPPVQPGGGTGGDVDVPPNPDDPGRM